MSVLEEQFGPMPRPAKQPLQPYFAKVQATFGNGSPNHEAAIAGLAVAQSLGMFLFTANPAGWTCVLVATSRHELLERASRLACVAAATGAFVEGEGSESFAALMRMPC